jgi:hypothetical protein
MALICQVTHGVSQTKKCIPGRATYFGQSPNSAANRSEGHFFNFENQCSVKWQSEMALICQVTHGLSQTIYIVLTD